MNLPIPPRPDLPPEMSFGSTPVGGSEETPKASWRWWEALSVFILGLLVAGILSAAVTTAVPSWPRFYVIAFIGDLVPFGVLVGWLQWQHRGWPAAMGIPARPWKEILAGAIGGVAAYVVVAVGVGFVLTFLFETVRGAPVDTPRQLPGQLSGTRLFLATVLAVIVAPVFEEFLFRGCLFRAMRARRPFWVAALGSSLLFGLAHYAPDKVSGQAGAWLLVVTMFLVGLCLAYIYERRGTIVASMAAHATFNIIGLFFIVSSLR